jgi:hypothetical protein
MKELTSIAPIIAMIAAKYKAKGHSMETAPLVLIGMISLPGEKSISGAQIVCQGL